MRPITFLLLLALSHGALSADTLVVCPEELKPALRKWAAYRQKQGHRIEWIASSGTDEDIRHSIRAAAKPKKTKFLVLVGDADPAASSDERIRALTVPTHHIPAQVNIHWGRERDIACDNWFADLDDDALPDLAVGRITADSPEELERIAKKIMDYEHNRDFGDWRRRISFVACPGNFGGVIDSVLEQGSRKVATEGIPPAFATTATYGNWRSPYCPDPRKFFDITQARLNEGALFWVYIGHGHCREVDRVDMPERKNMYPILRYDDIESLKCKAGQPIALFLACYTGMFDNREDSIAEEMLRTPGGPIAVIAASRVTIPYSMTVMGSEMMKEYFEKRCPTVGELFMNGKRAMVLADRTAPMAKSLDTIALTLNPLSPDLHAERLEHCQMFHLFGDPLMKLHHPESLDVSAPPKAEAGSEIVVKGTCPMDGQCEIELVPPRDKLPIKTPTRARFNDDEDFYTHLDDTYEKVNEPALSQKQVDVDAGPFEATLLVPPGWSGKAYVRVYLKGDKSCAVGATALEVTKPAAK